MDNDEKSSKSIILWIIGFFILVCIIVLIVLLTKKKTPDPTPTDSSDKCKGINCGTNGKCIDGKCKCKDGYSGDECSNIKEKQYHIIVKGIGNCVKYPVTINELKLQLNNKKEFPIFDIKKDTIWNLDKDGKLYTVDNGDKYYLGSSKHNMGTMFTYNKVTKDDTTALQLDKVSIINNNYDPNLIPILIGDYIYPGGGNANIFKSDTCTGYYLYFDEI